MPLTLSRTPRGPGRVAVGLLAALVVGLTGAAPVAAQPADGPDVRAIAAAITQLTGRTGDLSVKAEFGVGASTIATGDRHTCTLNFFGELWCWGANASGQLGVNSAAADSLVPVRVTARAPLAGRELLQVDAGAAHTCVVDGDGEVYCWGENEYGQLGVGNTTDSRRPVRVPGLNGIIKVAAGATHTCALTSGGTVSCWGRNNAGQLGTNSLAPDVDTPQDVTTLTGIVDLAAHESNTCAVKDNGTAWCWGSNEFGQLGDGSGSPRSRVPVAVDRSGVGNPQLGQIDVGRRHVCAVDDDGAGYCWGDDSAGQLGDGGPLSGSSVPVAVAAGGRVFSIVDLGTDTTCATDQSFNVSCWGENAVGQLGLGDTTDRGTPDTVAGGELAGLPLTARDGALLIEVDANFRHTCAIDLFGTVYCWGANDHGEFGDRTRGGSAVPARVSLGPGPVTGLRVEPADRALRTSWTAPADPGVGDLIGYSTAAVSASSEGDSCATAAATSCTVTGLSNGTRYGVFVLAASTAGFSFTPTALYATPQAAGGGAGLPVTGAALPLYLSGAALLLAAGLGAVLLVRRRVRFTA